MGLTHQKSRENRRSREAAREKGTPRKDLRVSNNIQLPPKWYSQAWQAFSQGFSENYKPMTGTRFAAVARWAALTAFVLAAVLWIAA
jgi:hypothetical protein